MSERDYYEVLQIHPKADHAVVIQAYWHLARKYKTAIGVDVGAERRLQELNQAFAVIGSADQRASYDLARAQTPAAPSQVMQKESPPKKQVTLDISYWHLPAWQGMLAATATLVLASLALLAGAHLVITLVFAAIAMTAALLPAPGEWKAFRSKGTNWSAQGERELKTDELERSTSAIIARWRQATRGHAGGPSLTQLLSGTDYLPSKPTSGEPSEDPTEAG